jgi:CspA family cold shock protein
MATGTVKFFNHDRGFGFIEPADGGSDVFVHATAVESAGLPALTEGQKLSYEVKTDQRSGKPAAVELRNA